MQTKRHIHLSAILLLLIAAGLMLILTACGGGASGGVKDGAIEVADARLVFGENQVPNSSKSTLSVMKLSDEEKPDGLSSDLFELYLDMTCDHPVTVSIPVTDVEVPEGETAEPMLGLGTEITLADGSADTLYSFVPAEVADGRATASFIPAQYMEQLSVNGASGTAKPSKERLCMGIFRNSTSFIDGGHFVVTFPIQVGRFFLDYNDRSLLLQDLEAVYNDYLSKGYTYAKRSEWPMEVHIQSLKDAEGYYSYKFDMAGGKIYLNSKLFRGGYEADAVRPLLAHEFFHFVQANYVGHLSDLLWFDEATATYFEGQVSGGLPNIVIEYNEKVFSGVFPEKNNAPNGYSRMPLIRFLADLRGEDFILNAYTIASSGADWETALLSSTGPPSGWAADFYEGLVKGDFNDYAPYTLHSNIAQGERPELGTALALKVPTKEEMAILDENNEVPILGSTTLSIGSYGAQLVAITIDEENLERIPDGLDPSVRVSDGDLRLLSARSKVVNRMGGNELENFKEASKNQTRFLAIVTGLHESGKRDYTLEVEFAPYPTLDELVGEYSNGTMLIKKVNVSEALLQGEAALSAEADEAGCDVDILRALKDMEGESLPYPMKIIKTGEDSGKLIPVEDGEESDPLPFIYANGELTFDVPDEGTRTTGFLLASYGSKKDVVIDGDLNMAVDGDDISIDYHLNGSKPLGPA